MPTYFSEKRGLRKGYGLPELRTIVRDLYNDLIEKDRLKEWVGYECIDAGPVWETELSTGSISTLTPVASGGAERLMTSNRSVLARVRNP